MVKNIVLLVCMAFVLQVGLAQNKLTQGKVIFQISYKNLPAIMVTQQSMLPRDAVFYFKDTLTRIEMGIANQGKNVTINNHQTGNIFILLNLYNQKFALIKHDSDLVALKKEMTKAEDTATTIEVEILKDMTKLIGGYTCTKAVIKKTFNGVTKESDCWFTPLLPPYSITNNPEFKKIDGFLMEYSSVENGITTTFKARNIVAVPIEDNMFEIPSTYKVVTEQELLRLYNYYQSMKQDSEY